MGGKNNLQFQFEKRKKEKLETTKKCEVKVYSTTTTTTTKDTQFAVSFDCILTTTITEAAITTTTKAPWHIVTKTKPHFEIDF